MLTSLLLVFSLTVPAWYQLLCINTGFVPVPHPEIQCQGTLTRNVIEVRDDNGNLIEVNVGYGTVINKAVDCVVDYDFVPRAVFPDNPCQPYSVPCHDPDRDKHYWHHGNLASNNSGSADVPLTNTPPACPVPGFPNGDPEDHSCNWWFGLGPDAGACEYIPPPAAVTPEAPFNFRIEPIGEWVFCANETYPPTGEVTCSFTGTHRVRYGADPVFVEKVLTNGTACDNDVFGDPIFGQSKYCEYWSTPN